MHLNEIKRVLISVTDKKGIVEFAQGLKTFGVEILSTGGTASQLRKSGVPVTDVSDYTGFPEMMDGRLKTLHPKIHGGLLALRDNESHMRSLREHQIDLIDMVVINLYRFEDTVAKEGCTLEHAIENIDIGGPTMLRAASKNYRFVSVVTDPEDYPKILAEMTADGGQDFGSDQLRTGEKDLPTHRPLRRRHFQLPRSARRRKHRKTGIPRHLLLPVRQGAGPPLRGEPPSEGRLLPGERPPAFGPLQRTAAPGKGALLQ